MGECFPVLPHLKAKSIPQETQITALVKILSADFPKGAVKWQLELLEVLEDVFFGFDFKPSNTLKLNLYTPRTKHPVTN